VFGGQGGPYVEAGAWRIAYGYRYQLSDRHFVGDHEERRRQAEGSEVINEVHLMDFGFEYAISSRFRVGASVPLLVAERSQPIRQADRAIVGRNVTEAFGLGDVSILGSAWLLDPAEHPTANISLGLGVKFPTGEDDVEDDFASADGTVTRRTVDQSIQPGNGGFGAVVDLRAFAVLFDTVTVFGHGTYLFEPRNTNGVLTGRGRPSEAVMSVADQYLGRIGLAIPLVPEHGLSLLLAGRAEAVPVRDLIGGSDGFRRPGIAVSFEPGLVWSNGPHTVAVTVPVAVYRNRWQSVPDREDGRRGDAAFADYLILVSYSFDFGA